MELTMNRRVTLTLAGAAAAVFIAWGSAQAAPAFTPVPSMQEFAGSVVEQVHCRRYRHCHRRCHWTRWGWRCWRRCHRC
jgi:hypothetical protein